MKLSGEGKLLRIFLGEADHADGQQLFEAIVHLARSKGLAGASVFRGVEGFGAHSRIHKSAILDLSEDLPILVEIVDTSEKVEALIPEIDALIEKANCGVMMTIEKVDVRKYSAGK
jgi:PII-like signaling protein